jgi:hypothetical protein
MRRKSDKLSWDDDGKTAEAPTSYSQQRLKAVKPRMSWGDDACTVARPADAVLPEAAFRPDLVDAIEISEAVEAVELGEEPQPVEIDNASAASVPEAPPQLAAPAQRTLPRAAHHPWRRRVLLALTIPAFYVLSYTTVRVVQKLHGGASPSQLWGAVREVLQEAVDPPRSAPAGTPSGAP